MRFHWPFLTLLLLQLVFAEQAEFSSKDLEEVPAASARTQEMFFYRLQTDSVLHFYRIVFTSQMYQGMRVFRWPEAIGMAKRATTPLFGGNEIVFNNHFVLSNSDALFYKSDTGLVPLEKTLPPGILYLRSASPATWQGIDRRGIEPEEPLPAMIYTWNDTAKPCLIRSAGFVPVEYDPYTPVGTYRVYEATLEPLPHLALAPHFLYDNVELAPADSALKRVLDARIAELQKELLADSLRINSFLDSLRTNYPKAMPLRNYEDSTDYLSRERVRDVEARALASQAYTDNGFTKVLTPLRERIAVLQVRLAQVERELKEDLEPQHAVLHQQVWNRVFISVTTTLGQNLPNWTRDNGPRSLWELGAQLSANRRLGGLWTLELLAQGGYSQWENYPTHASFENWGGLGAVAGYPLVASLAHHFTWIATAGLHTTFRYTRVHDESETEMRSGMTAGPSVGTELFCGKLPLRIGVDYSYDLDRFGDLRLQIGLPLPGLGGHNP